MFGKDGELFVSTLEITPQEVGAWLDTLRDDDPTGRRWSMPTCPLATYLHWRDSKDWYVGTNICWTALVAYTAKTQPTGQLEPELTVDAEVAVPSSYLRLPAWASRFVTAIDDKHDKLDIFFDHKEEDGWFVTAAQARRALEKVSAAS